KREIVSVLPRFRVVAMSMKRLQIGRARIASVTVGVIDLDPVVMLEEQPTRATASLLCFEQFGESGTDLRVSSPSRAPVPPVPIIGTAVAFDLDMPGKGHLAVCQEMRGIQIGGGGRKGEAGAQPVPHTVHASGGRVLPSASPWP